MNTRKPHGTPTIADLAKELVYLKRQIDDDFRATDDFDDETPAISCRLQVVNGRWTVWDGDPQFDTDHRGFWSHAVLTRQSNCREIAKEMIDEVTSDFLCQETGDTTSHQSQGGAE